MVELLTVLEAYREGKLSLTPGYSLEHGAEALLLRREVGSEVGSVQRQEGDVSGCGERCLARPP